MQIDVVSYVKRHLQNTEKDLLLLSVNYLSCLFFKRMLNFQGNSYIVSKLC